jgi:hypothetical protein
MCTVLSGLSRHNIALKASTARKSSDPPRYIIDKQVMARSPTLNFLVPVSHKSFQRPSTTANHDGDWRIRHTLIFH